MADAAHRRNAQQWRDLAYAAIPRFVQARGGAVVWPEVEGLLAHQDGWLADHAPDLGPAKRIDPHHLGHARQLLLETGLLTRVDAQLSGREVTAYLDGTATATRRQTAVERLGASKRRLYRTFLSWTSNTPLCGGIAEQHVAATLDSLTGRVLWLDPNRGAREARTINGEPVPGGPLDHAGHIAHDPADPTAGFVPFLIEDKNLRQTLYPEHREIFDLLWKAGHYPDHVPILIAPRLHHTTYVFFSAIGALAAATTRQWFAPAPTIEAPRFHDVVGRLAIGHATQLSNPTQPSSFLTGFFSKTLYRPSSFNPDASLLQHSQTTWQTAAPIFAQPAFRELREQIPSHRRSQLYQQLLEELAAEDLPVHDLLPLHTL